MVMNTLNLLAPALLLAALILAAVAKLGDHAAELRRLLLQMAAIAVIAALLIRVIWGIGIRIVRRRSTGE